MTTVWNVTTTIQLCDQDIPMSTIINIPDTKEQTWMKRMMVTTAQVIMQMMTVMKTSKHFTFQQPQQDLNGENSQIQVS